MFARIDSNTIDGLLYDEMSNLTSEPRLGKIRVCSRAVSFKYLTQEASLIPLIWNALSGVVIELQLSFANRSLRDICESSAKANRKLGIDAANELRRRVADLRAATSVHDLLIGEPRGIDENQIVLDVGTSFQIIFCANHNTMPRFESGEIDWSKVSRVKILEIESKNA